MRKRWWVLLGAPTTLLAVSVTYLLVRWVQYRRFEAIDLSAILPEDAQAAVRIRDLSGRWPELSKAPALLALAHAQDPERGDAPLSLAELARLAGARIDEAEEGRVMDLAGRDVAVGLVFIGGRVDAVVVTRIPFSYFLLEPFLGKMLSAGGAPATRSPSGVVSAGDRHVAFCGDIVVAGTRADWVEAALTRAETGTPGKAAQELAAAAPDGEPAFWIDVTAARQDTKFGPELKKLFHAVPVREGLHMLDLEATRAVSGRLVLEGGDARLEGTFFLSSKLGDRLEKMYAMESGESGLFEMLPANTCYVTGARVDPPESWRFLNQLTKPGKGSGKRKTLSAGFGDFVENVYIYLHDGMESAEDHGVANVVQEVVDRDIAIALTTEKEEPFLGLTVLARVTDGPRVMDQLVEFFKWLHDDPKGGNKAFQRREETVQGVTVQVLDGKFDVLGAGVKPAFAVADGVLVISTSFETVKGILEVKLAGGRGFAAGGGVAALRAQAPADGPSWAFADVGAFRASLEGLKGTVARLQVERTVSGPETQKKVADTYRGEWEAGHSGQPWVEAEHVAAIDEAYHAHLARERARIEGEIRGFSRRLERISGMAFVVRRSRENTLDWKLVLRTAP
jgi:hypothetical protein